MLSIILVNYNNTHHTINCLKSLQNQNYKNFEIIIIDNASQEFFKKQIDKFLKSNELIESFRKKIKVYYSKKNTGFTGGNNLGIKRSKGDIILFLNCDTIHEPDFLKNMIEFFNKYKFVQIAQPKICYFYDKNKIWFNGGLFQKFYFNVFKPLDGMKNEKDVLKKPFRIDYSQGCAFFIRRDIIKEIGMLDNDFFCYCEECDLCYRANLKGYNNIYCNPNAKIYHNTRPGFSKAFKKYYFRNRMIFCLKHFSFPLIIWQFFIQFIQLFIFTINIKKKVIDYFFFFNSIKGILNGIKIGIIRRLQLKMTKIKSLRTKLKMIISVLFHRFFSIYLNQSAFKILEFKELLKDIIILKEDLVLDIGCGDGYITQILGKRCKKIYGIDIDKSSIELAYYRSFYSRKRIKSEFHFTKIENAGFKANYFNKIFSICVLEHIKNYHEVLKECYRILKKNGQMIISIDSLENIKNDNFIAYHKKELKVHNFFTKNGFRNILENIGFKKIIIYPILRSEYATQLFIKTHPHFKSPFLISLLRYLILKIKENRCNNKDQGIFLIAKCVK